MRLLAAAGGAAVSIGLIFFVAYAIEQDWLSPGLRFVGAAFLSALLTVAAWPVARRGHQAVAGAIGGAGLGAWFGSWLFARHVHDLVSGPLVFVALVLGAVACLAIADRLHLRLMAILSTLAACATPLLVGVGSGPLIELMAYKLMLVGVLVAVDYRRHWPELPTIALMSTWMLGARWAALHLGPESALGFMIWTLVLLVATAISGWRLVQASAAAADKTHAKARLVVGGLLTWAAAAWAFAHAPQTLACASLGLAAWHVALAWLLIRVDARASTERDARTEPRRIGDVFVGLAWAQAMVAGLLAFDDAILSWWWIGMSVAAAALSWAPIRRMRQGMVLIPAVAATAWAVHSDEPWSLTVAAVAVAVPMIAGLIGTRDSEGPRALEPMLTSVAALMWLGVTLAIGPEASAAQLTWALIPVAVTVGRVCLLVNERDMTLALGLLGLGLLASLAVVVTTSALSPVGAEPGAPLGLVLPLLGLAGLGVTLTWRMLQAKAIAQPELELDDDPNAGPLGLMVALAVGLAGALVVVGAATGGGLPVQLGSTACAALTALGLLVAGLRLRQTTWRKIGLAVIGAAAIKIVLFDLAAASAAWRALSLVGIGAVMIGGAFAYSRAQQRLSRARASS
ncbi:hypothetical protein ENSA5_57960 [Enhygromyxa salina]|uniref:DUF2339 domain-containing protein n=1 Tax=Enhygromyxa salina TaxID=215803 RepID=A0A2S9XE45_9BACT|nr:DUF2339 domain-containing protein [Enhygromyxa salina]PRP91136.1 hypothetical protein ENSA5_57960 [Enhygromyxa salina]